MIHTHNDSHLTIGWSHSSEYTLVRYIVEVRRYVAREPGKVEVQTVTGYPRELPSTQLTHTVASLSKTLLL